VFQTEMMKIFACYLFYTGKNANWQLEFNTCFFNCLIAIKELIFCHKLKFLILISLQCNDTPLIFHKTIGSNRILSLKYQRSTTSSCKDTYRLQEKLVLKVILATFLPWVLEMVRICKVIFSMHIEILTLSWKQLRNLILKNLIHNFDFRK